MHIVRCYCTILIEGYVSSALSAHAGASHDVDLEAYHQVVRLQSMLSAPLSVQIARVPSAMQVKGHVLSALAKVHAQARLPAGEGFAQLLHNAASSHDADLQLRAVQIQSIFE